MELARRPQKASLRKGWIEGLCIDCPEGDRLVPLIVKDTGPFPTSSTLPESRECPPAPCKVPGMNECAKHVAKCYLQTYI